MDTVEKTVMMDQTEDLILRSQQADHGLDLHSQDKLELVLVMDRVEGMVSQCFLFDVLITFVSASSASFKHSIIFKYN